MAAAKSVRVLAGETAQPCVAGTIVTFHRKALENDLGQGIVAQALENLEPDQRREILDALPISWVPHTTLEALYRESAKLSGRGVADLHTDIVRRGVEYRVRNLWRIVVRLSSASALVARSQMIYEKSYSVGVMRVLDSGRKKQALIAIEGWPEMPEMAIRGVSVGTHTLLALAGFKNVQVACERRPDGAHVRVLGIV